MEKHSVPQDRIFIRWTTLCKTRRPTLCSM
jgi:hypothetical protein